MQVYEKWKRTEREKRPLLAPLDKVFPELRVGILSMKSGSAAERLLSIVARTSFDGTSERSRSGSYRSGSKAKRCSLR